MSDDKLKRLLHRFAIAAVAHHEALEDMDEQRANAHARMISGLYRSIAGEGNVGMEALLALVDDPNPVVAGMSPYCTRVPLLHPVRLSTQVHLWHSSQSLIERGRLTPYT